MISAQEQQIENANTVQERIAQVQREGEREGVDEPRTTGIRVEEAAVLVKTGGLLLFIFSCPNQEKDCMKHPLWEKQREGRRETHTETEMETQRLEKQT